MIPLLYSWRNERRIASDKQEVGAMQAIMRGLTDAEFERLYGTEAQCLAAWVKVRQDAGMPCPRCDNPKSYVYDRRVGCTRCDMRWSITSGTVMADTKLLPDYLGAFCWTTNHRRNMRGMIGALCSAAASSSRLTRRSVYA